MSKCKQCGKDFNGISNEYYEVYKLLDKWTRKVYKDSEQPLSDIAMAIDNIYVNKNSQKHDPRTCDNSKPCFDCEHPIAE